MTTVAVRSFSDIDLSNVTTAIDDNADYTNKNYTVIDYN